MERKLVRQGRDALTVTLPSKWLKSRGLKAGDSVNIEQQESSLMIGSKMASSFTEITLDVTADERSILWHKIIGAYIRGYDKIVLMHNNPKDTKYFSIYLLGMIVEEHTNTKTVLRSVVSVPEADIGPILRRIGHMFLQQAVLLEDISRGKAQFDDLKEQERLLDTNVYYCLRFINKYNLKKSAFKHFLLCSTIESGADVVTKIAELIGKNALLASSIREMVEKYTSGLYSKDLNTMYSAIRTFKKNMKRKTFIDGLSYELTEILYNNIGFLVKDKSLT